MITQLIDRKIFRKLTSTSFCLLVVLASFNANSQGTYFDNNPIWKIKTTCVYVAPDCFEVSVFNYFLNGDTVINALRYKKLFRIGYSFLKYTGPPPLPMQCQGFFMIGDSTFPVGFIRDTLMKVYYADLSQSDTILYDYNLSVGDTLPETYLYDDQNGTVIITITGIDTINVGERIRRRFYLSPNADVPYIIEGIGHPDGFLFPIQTPLNCASELQCYSVNDTSYYPLIGEDCDIALSSNETLSKDQIKISPNPTSGLIQIQGLSGNCDVSIYNIQGSRIGKPVAVSKGNESHIIDLSSVNNGLYVVVVYCGQSQLHRKVIIKY